MVSKEEFIDWKKSSITEAVFQGVAERIKEGMIELSHTAGEDSGMDRFKCGMLAAYRNILNIEFEDMGGEDA